MGLRLKVTVCSSGPGVKTAIYSSIEVKSPVVRELDRRKLGHFGGVVEKSVEKFLWNNKIFFAAGASHKTRIRTPLARFPRQC